MEAALTPEVLLARAAWLEGRLNALPKPTRGEGLGFDWRPYREGVEALKNELVRLPYPAARCDEDWQGARLTMMGITAKSTGGFAGACRNWIAAARKKGGQS